MKWVVFFALVFNANANYLNIKHYRQKVKDMFIHSYDSYMTYAYPLDELKPLSCSGMNTWGNFSLTLIDSLDSLIIMGNESEFVKAAQLVIQNVNFNMDINASVFETNIRVVGGLLGAHFMSGQTKWGQNNGYPCRGPLLDLAKDVAKRLLPAFNTVTGLPYGTVNLMFGVPANETPVTCTASCNTFALEFFALSALTGDPSFKDVALRSAKAMWLNHRSALGMVGNHIDTHSGKWVGKEAGIGSGVDSYFEYLVKGALLSKDPVLMKMFLEYEKVINKYMNYNNWYFWVNMNNGNLVWPIYQSLESFWPGLLVSLGRISEAEKSFKHYHRVWMKYGGLPETFNVLNGEYEHGHSNYPLRPEFIESAYHLYRATKNPYYLKVGIDVVESLERFSRTPCGYAVIKDIATHTKDDRMESFFLAETLKYLYLLFDTENTGPLDNQLMTQTAQYLITTQYIGNKSQSFIEDLYQAYATVPVNSYENYKNNKPTTQKCIVTSGGYQFNTEAHPIHMSAVECCGKLNEKNQNQPETPRFEGKLEFPDIDSLTLIDANKELSPSPLSETDVNKIEKWIHNLGPLPTLPEQLSISFDLITEEDILALLDGDYSIISGSDNSHLLEDINPPFIFRMDENDALHKEASKLEALPNQERSLVDPNAKTVSSISNSPAFDILGTLSNLMVGDASLTSLDIKQIINEIGQINEELLTQGDGATTEPAQSAKNGFILPAFNNDSFPSTSFLSAHRQPLLILDMCDQIYQRHFTKVGDCVNRRWALQKAGAFNCVQMKDAVNKTKYKNGKRKWKKQHRIYDINYLQSCIFKCHLQCCPYVAYLPKSASASILSATQVVDFNYFRNLRQSANNSIPAAQPSTISKNDEPNLGKTSKQRLTLDNIGKLVKKLTSHTTSSRKNLTKSIRLNQFPKAFTNPRNLLCPVLS